jgi:tripartite-type tricarboxylate transporter receptor subunit TctC
MRRFLGTMAVAAVALAVALSGCGQTAPATSPTQAPAAPKAAEPTKAPTAAPAATTAAPAKAAWPEKGKTITLLLPYSAGGATDLAARLLAAEMEKDFGTPVQVVNKAGGGGQEAMTELTTAKPDGYTLMVCALPSILATYLDPERKATFSSKNLQMLARLVTSPSNLAVKADGPYKTFEDVVNAAKANPGKIPFGAGTQLSGYHFGALQVEKVTGTTFAIVNFPGGVDNVTALAGGHVDLAINQAGELLSQVKGGIVRVVGVADTKENKFFPGVKTLESQGYKIYSATHQVAVGPAGLPKDVVDIVSAEIQKVAKQDQFIQKMADMGLDVSYLNGEQLGTVWGDVEAQVGPMIQQIRTQQ